MTTSKSKQDMVDELLSDKSFALQTIAEDDLPYENDMIRDPYSVRAWIRYLNHKLGYLETVPVSHYILLYERAVRTLPGSYKLWKQYLEWCKTHLRKLDGGEREDEASRITGVYRRALLTLHKMPRLWTELLSHLTRFAPHRVSLIRRTFDGALLALPTTQHERIWELYLPWAESVGSQMAVHVHKRYLKMEPSRLFQYITLLLEIGRYNDAATQLLRAIKLQTNAGKEASYEMFDKLCTLAVEHPDALPSVSVEDILRAGLRRFPHQSAKFWNSLARYWIHEGRLETARSVFEEAMRTVVTMRDFTQVFDTFLEFEERVVTAQMARVAKQERLAKKKGVDYIADEMAQLDIDMRLERLERLMNRRPSLVNSVLLRQNPHNVMEWLKRVNLFKDDEAKCIATFKDSIKTIHPKQATGKLDELWAAYAHFYEERGQLDRARQVFEEAVKVEYKSVPELAGAWIEYAEMELRHQNIETAIDLIGRATAIPANTSVDFRDQKLPPQRRLFKSLQLWSFYIDLEECFGSKDAVVAVYDSVLALKIATPQVIVNYAMYLESLDYFEASYQVYERGIELFKWPMALDLWNIYVAKFLDRHTHEVTGGVAMERLRELFEMSVDGCPEQYSRALYLVYANLEEEHGLARRAMRVYERATRAVPADQKRGMYAYYISRVIHHFGLLAAREVYERAVSQLPDAAAATLCLEFAALELRLGEVDRARAIFAHGSQLGDPRTHQRYWSAWHDFEVKYGNEDTFKEMLRIKRSVQAQYNTEVNYIAAQLAVARNRQKIAQEREAAAAAAAAADAGAKSLGDRNITFVSSTGGAAVADEEGMEEPADRLIAGNVKQVAQKAVPAAVFGKAVDLLEQSKANGSKPADEDDAQDSLGAKARLAKRRKV